MSKHRRVTEGKTRWHLPGDAKPMKPKVPPIVTDKRLMRLVYALFAAFCVLAGMGIYLYILSGAL